ncbi:MAG: MOSC domain-containing protein [Arenicella sp.]|nr:MOSC domain-containing protein [Arenicella sp.]
MTKLSISELHIYPVKSARGISLETMQLNRKGPECDRRWMVIDHNNNFVTQRKTPKMCLINTQAIDGGLLISANDAGECALPTGGYALIESSVWGTDVKGQDCGDQAADWISSFLGKECRIIYMLEDYSRPVDSNFASQNEQVGFADGFPLLITSEASLDDFNSKLANSEPDFKIAMNRFRPNIVITGNAPWAEDQWQKIAIGNIEFSLVKPCSRCIIPSIDPHTSNKQMRVNQTLLKYRRRDGKTYFGQNALYNRLGSISVGDTIRVIR